MKITLDGVEYHTTSDAEKAVIERIWQTAEAHYGKLSTPLRLAMKAAAREVLRQMEKGKDAKTVQALRPPKGGDPIEHLARMMFAVIAEGVKHVEAAITTNSNHEIAAVSIAKPDTGESGGQVVIGGDFGQRQDNGDENA